MINTVEKIYFEGTFSCYLITYNNGKTWTCPHSEDNRHYQEIQKWIAEGNTVIDNPPEGE